MERWVKDGRKDKFKMKEIGWVQDGRSWKRRYFPNTASHCKTRCRYFLIIARVENTKESA